MSFADIGAHIKWRRITLRIINSLVLAQVLAHTDALPRAVTRLFVGVANAIARLIGVSAPG